jgi:hypothetical protein
MAVNTTPNRELRQRRLLKQIEKLIPQMIEEPERGNAICTSRLGVERLSDGRLLQRPMPPEIAPTSGQITPMYGLNEA